MYRALHAFHKYLKENNLQQTSQRDLIVETFIQAKTHVSVEDLYHIVRKKEPNTGQVTVFRTLKILEDAGIASPVNFRDKTIRYELKHGIEHHDHLVCLNCGSVIEVLDENLETIQDNLCKKYDFKPLNHRLEIFGTCKECS